MATKNITELHEAIAAETRSEVEKLHDKVDSLGKLLPRLINFLESSADAQVGRVVTTINTLKTEGDNYATLISNKVLIAAKTDSLKTQKEFDNRYRQASEDSLKEISDGARNSIYHHVAKPVSEFIQEQKDNVWKTYGICFACALVGALVFSLMAAPPKYTKEEKLQLQWGEKLAKAWDKVDKKTRDLIESQ